MPHTILGGHSFPMDCPKCQHVAGMPFIAGTVLNHGAIQVGMRCRDCAHEWRFDLPVTTQSRRDSGTHSVAEPTDEAFDRR